MKKSFWIIYSICILMIFLILIIILLFPNIGINNDIYNGKRPIDMGEAIWYSEDGKSWFKVDDSSICIGELSFKGKIYPVYYKFENFNRLYIYSKDTNEKSTDFYGICKFKKNKMSVEISYEKNLEYVEKITFIKANITQA